MILKNIFLGSLIFLGLSSFGQVINFPDSNFKNALVNTKCVDLDGDGFRDADADLNDDGEIEIMEALVPEFLYLNSNFIKNLSGIEHFSNLKTLSCSSNQIDSLNINSLKKLTLLYCSNNKIKSLDLENLKFLKEIFCFRNEMQTLVLDSLDELISIRCEENNLKTISLGKLPNLEVLSCHNNLIDLLNLTAFDSLKILHCNNNKLAYLNFGIKNNLIEIYCQNNGLSNLDISDLKNLNRVDCSFNKINTLNIENSEIISYLVCNNNLIESINVSKLSRLTLFDCSENNINVLEFPKLNSLTTLTCNGNNLNFLNLENLHNLETLRCYNSNIWVLNIKTGNEIDFIQFGQNLLFYICCNENEITNIKGKLLSEAIFTCEVNTYCSFTPGGNYYILKGENRYDVNSDGCNDQDIKMSNFKYNITNGIITGTIISNSTGNYSIPVQPGTHTITPILEYPSHFDVTPSSYTVALPSTSDTITQDFCITPKGVLNKTNITIIPLSPPARPGFEAQYKIVWENAGNQIESGTLNFTYDETLLDYISATQTADLKSDGIVSWYFNNLLPFEKREITVTLKVNRPTDTPAVNAGDKLYLTASILDNIFTLENTVVGSYDPNDKTCLQGDRVKPDMVGEYVDYLIRFENTGNFAAENVVVKDIIDTKTFDISTLKITDASHEVYTRIEGNKVEFIFENINLPFDDANNDGYIAFKIKTLPSLVLGDSLKNLADIYFDYNFPIRTNEAQTTIAYPVFTKDITTEVKIYPNPVSDILYLDTDENWNKADIYDIAGRIMRSISLNGQSMDVSGLESGTYFIRLKDGDIVGLVKFVKI